MQFFKAILAVAALFALAACDPVPLEYPGQGKPQVDVSQLPSMRVEALDIQVPRTLRVSEEDSYFPDADIVWREDPFGDRYQQVEAILREGISRGVHSLQGDMPVVVHVTLKRFHALTERTRRTVGGTHAIDFFLSVTNARTGEVVIPPYLVSTRLIAYGGARALEAEHKGITQKVRITDHLAKLIRQELTGVPMDQQAQN